MLKQFRKYRNILLIFAVVSLILPLSALGQQKINLFRSKVHTFSIVFPDGWQQRNGQTPRTVVVSENAERASIIIQVFQSPAEVDLQNIADEDLSGLINDTFAGLKAKMYPDAVLMKSGTTFIANKKATWMLFTYSIKQAFVTEKVKTMLYTVFNGSKMYQILCTSPVNRYDYFDKIFLSAVRSFVFEDASWYK